MACRIILFLLILFQFGCKAIWQGSIDSSLAIPPEKYHVVGPVSAEVRTFVLFYLVGGHDHKQLVLEAKNKLLASHKPDSNQVLGDWSVSFKNIHTLFGLIQKCEVSANLISLVPLPRKEVPVATFTGKETADPKPIVAGQVPVKGKRVQFEVDGIRYEGIVLKATSTTMKIEYYDPATKTIKKTNKFVRDVKLIPE